MKDIFKNFLFTKQILVNDTGMKSKDAFNTILALARLFNIKIIAGGELQLRNII